MARIKEINFDEIIKVANHFSDKFIPSFFIENKYQDLIKKIKDNVKNAIIKQVKNIMQFLALTKFNKLIMEISHMLSFSNNKNYIFYKIHHKFLPFQSFMIVN